KVKKPKSECPKPRLLRFRILSFGLRICFVFRASDFVLLYLAASSLASFLRLSQLYLRWNFSTRPVVSTYFILPVKKGWHAEQISTMMFFLMLRVVKLLPQLPL